jgi:hypothetical protein
MKQQTKVGLVGVVCGLLGFAILFLAGWIESQTPVHVWYRNAVNLSFFILSIACFVVGVFCLVGWAVWEGEDD